MREAVGVVAVAPAEIDDALVARGAVWRMELSNRRGPSNSYDQAVLMPAEIRQADARVSAWCLTTIDGGLWSRRADSGYSFGYPRTSAWAVYTALLRTCAPAGNNRRVGEQAGGHHTA